jgi:hypothetical protein
MNILWYQHIEHGTKCIISLKNKLPSVAILATKKHKKIMLELIWLFWCIYMPLINLLDYTKCLWKLCGKLINITNKLY